MPSINAIKVTEEFLSVLPKRARDVLERRFGLGKFHERKTLEAIGSSYGITRERVRQIEAYGLKKLRSHSLMKERGNVFHELKEELSRRGGIAEENKFLTELASNPDEKNHINFLLTLHDDFKRIKEDDEFHHRWISDSKSADACHETLKVLHKDLESQEPLAESDIKLKLASTAKNTVSEGGLTDQAISSWLAVSKMVKPNKLGEWGLVSSPHISPRGVRDLAFLVMKRHGSPMHFSGVAGAIRKNLGEKAHVQTVHNELIKDTRFVLVGRGLYALKEWGYEPGTVREIIKNILVSSGPMAKDKLIEKVLKERHVKLSTIKINLQDKRHFKTLEDGQISVA